MVRFWGGAGVVGCGGGRDGGNEGVAGRTAASLVGELVGSLSLKQGRELEARRRRRRTRRNIGMWVVKIESGV